jgi:hypothetical protein
MRKVKKLWTEKEALAIVRCTPAGCKVSNQAKKVLKDNYSNTKTGRAK